MIADGSGALRVAGHTAFRWSPDGDRIAFNCVVEGANVDICLINADGTGLVRLTTDPAVDADPTWSPDGTRIGFWSNRGGARELYVMDVAGSGVTQLTDNVGVNGMPAWSPDGGRIAFSCVVDSPNRDICAINADGTGFRRLTSASEDEYFAAWSPSGSRITFTVPFVGPCSDYCEGDIYLMNADGTSRRLFATGHNPVWISSSLPVASFQYGCSGATCTFDASGSSDNGTITSYAWDLGDGTTGSGLTVSHAFPSGRAYTVTLTVTDNDGLTGTKSEIVDLNERPAASFTFACQGFTCTVDGSASWDPDGAITSYAWHFGDGTTGSGATVSHTYAAPGVYGVTLTVTDDGGATGTQSTSVSINAPPVASSTFACNGLTCNFGGSGSSDPDGTITSYAWTFGDGMTASGPTVSHTYVAAGTYIVTLTVTDNGGATGTQGQNVTVSQAHVADLDRASTSQSGSWTAIVTIAVHDSSHSPVANATVSGSWSNGGTGSCMTNSGGQCTVSKRSPGFSRRPEA
jgi:PKD repeat protein